MIIIKEIYIQGKRRVHYAALLTRQNNIRNKILHPVIKVVIKFYTHGLTLNDSPFPTSKTSFLATSSSVHLRVIKNVLNFALTLQTGALLKYPLNISMLIVADMSTSFRSARWCSIHLTTPRRKSVWMCRSCTSSTTTTP